jgi:hypothetical protein
MRIYNFTPYHNIISEPVYVQLEKGDGDFLKLKLVPEFSDVESALEEKEMLSYALFTDDAASVFAGRLLFPWMAGWKYEGDYFDNSALKAIGKRIYYWVGLWGD